MNLEGVIRELERTYEVEFKPSKYLEQDSYTAYINNKERLDIHISTYKTGDERDGKEFISVSYTNNKNWSGYGYPCGNIEEVFKCMNRHFQIKKQLSFF